MKDITKIYYLILLLLFNYGLLAQGVVTGKVVDADKNPIGFANLLMLEGSDSTFVKGALTDETGLFQFSELELGEYLIEVSMVGYQTKFVSILVEHEMEELHLDDVVLSEGVQLREVEVTAKKPLYQQKIDRLVVNVENSVVAVGGTALQILERSPGVIVDRQNNNISLVGKDGVNVMINGRISYMPVSSLVQFLEGTSADNIKSIELITTPPANLDAEGNAGYINIILKENPDEGINGSYTIGGGYGNGGVSNNSLTVNLRKNKLNLYGNYSYVLRAIDQLFQVDRSSNFEGIQETAFTIADRDPIQRNHNARIGLDYQLSDKTIIGGLFTAYNNKWSLEAVNTARNSENNQLIRIDEIANIERNQWWHKGGNLNLKHDFNEDTYFSFDINYLNYKNENPTDYFNSVFDGNSNFVDEEMIESDKNTSIDVWAGALDFHRKLSDRVSSDAGVKIVQSTFDNDVIVRNFIEEQWEEDAGLTNLSQLNERILAAYLSSDVQLSDKTSAKFGLRYEFTDSELDVDTEGRVVDREFGRLFPSAFLSHNFQDDLSINLSYSQRITRPTFREMAPFVYFLDLNNFFAGNTGVQPAITDAYKLDLNYKTLFFSAQYSFQDSTIARFQQRFDPETKRLIFIADNLKNSKIWSFTLGYPWTVNKWWNMRMNANYYIQKINAFQDGSLVKLENNYVQLNTTQSFSLSKGFSFEAVFFYTGPYLTGTLEWDAIYALNLGLQKDFGEKWGKVSINVDDVFNSLEWNINSNVPSQQFFSDNSFDFSHPTFRISYSRRFGKSKVKGSRQRTTGSEEERSRAN